MGRNTQSFIKNLQKSGNDFKISLEIDDAMYILKPYIIVFPKKGKYEYAMTLASVRTWPFIIIDDGKNVDLNNWNKISIVEASINFPNDVSIIDYKQFYYGVKTKTSVMDKLKNIFYTSQIKENIDYKRIKSPVRWFVKMNKNEIIEYKNIISKTNH